MISENVKTYHIYIYIYIYIYTSFFSQIISLSMVMYTDVFSETQGDQITIDSKKHNTHTISFWEIHVLQNVNLPK